MSEFKDTLERGMIIQINETYNEMQGCLLIIDEILDTHIMAYMPMPNYMIQYFHIEYDEFDVVGAAALLREPLVVEG